MMSISRGHDRKIRPRGTFSSGMATPGGATADQKKADLALLSADTRMIVQVAPAFAPIPVDVLIDKIPAAAIGNANKDQIKADLTKAVLLVAEMTSP